MTNVEKRFFDFIRNNIPAIFLAAVTVLGLALRSAGMSFHSDDFRDFLEPWWNEIVSKGSATLTEQVGNYNIPYQIIIYLMTLISTKAIAAYKIFSIFFDFLLAVSSALVVKELDGGRSELLPMLTYAAVLCSPTVVMNSAFWAQCDSIYVSFIILAVYFTLRDKRSLCFVMLGLAFAFKLQTVFIIPLFLFWYILNKKISIAHFLIIPAVVFILCLPAVIMGRNPLDIITIYADQTDYGKLIQMNFPNFYAFICSGSDTANYYLFKPYSIYLTMLILGSALCALIYIKADLSDKKLFMWTAIWSVFTCLMFLSSMHERYAYLLDILLIIYAIAYKKRIWTAAAATLVSLRGYSYYLFSYEAIDLKLTSVVYTALYIYVTVAFIKDVWANRPTIAEE